jgi:hypothetical protein
MREPMSGAKDEDDGLEALLLEGLASKSIPLDGEFWLSLGAKTEQILTIITPAELPPPRRG